MRLRTFTASDMQAAIKMVRDAMGDGAVIIASEEKLNGKRTVSVTAAVEQEEEESGQWLVASDQKKEPSFTDHRPLATDHRPLATDHLRFDIQEMLRFHNLPELFAAKLMQQASGLDSVLALHRMGRQHDQYQLLRLAVEKIVGNFFAFEPLQTTAGNHLMLVGPPGAGKTLAVAKLVTKLVLDEQPPAVITADTKRAGGVEQLRSFTDILGLELHVASSRTELLRHLKALPEGTSALIDTAGCNPYDPAELQELVSYATLPDIEPVLVLPAGGDGMEAIDLAEAFMALPIERLLVTRADLSRRLGAALAAAAAHGLTFCNWSASASVTDAPSPASAALLAQLLLRYRLQTTATSGMVSA